MQSNSLKSYQEENFQAFVEALVYILNSMELTLNQSLDTVSSLKGLADMALVEMAKDNGPSEGN